MDDKDHAHIDSPSPEHISKCNTLLDQLRKRHPVTVQQLDAWRNSVVNVFINNDDVFFGVQRTSGKKKSERSPRPDFQNLVSIILSGRKPGLRIVGGGSSTGEKVWHNWRDIGFDKEEWTDGQICNSKQLQTLVGNGYSSKPTVAIVTSFNGIKTLKCRWLQHGKRWLDALSESCNVELWTWGHNMKSSNFIPKSARKYYLECYRDQFVQDSLSMRPSPSTSLAGDPPSRDLTPPPTPPTSNGNKTPLIPGHLEIPTLNLVSTPVQGYLCEKNLRCHTPSPVSQQQLTPPQRPGQDPQSDVSTEYELQKIDIRMNNLGNATQQHPHLVYIGQIAGTQQNQYHVQQQPRHSHESNAPHLSHFSVPLMVPYQLPGHVPHVVQVLPGHNMASGGSVISAHQQHLQYNPPVSAAAPPAQMQTIPITQQPAQGSTSPECQQKTAQISPPDSPVVQKNALDRTASAASRSPALAQAQGFPYENLLQGMESSDHHIPSIDSMWSGDSDKAMSYVGSALMDAINAIAR
jgi:hypothetical protein